jgi:1-acyl-sn-glycerol-3-phosphate acyltransferase
MTSTPNVSTPERVARAIATGACFAGFWTGAVLCALFVLPLVRIWSWRQHPAARTARCQRIVSWGFGLLMHSMRGLRLIDFHPARARIPVPDGPFVMIANHPTLVDVVAVISVHRNLCTIAKASLFAKPFIGGMLRSCGHIEGTGRSATAMGGAAVIRTAVERLEAGFSVLIFPEGTRSPAGSVGRMSRGAFEIARIAGVPLVPVFISCDPPTLARGMAWWALPKTLARLRFTPLPVARMEDFGGDARAAAAHYQAAFAARAADTKRGRVLGPSRPSLQHGATK